MSEWQWHGRAGNVYISSILSKCALVGQILALQYRAIFQAGKALHPDDWWHDGLQTSVLKCYMLRRESPPFCQLCLESFESSPDLPSLCIPLSSSILALQVHVEQQTGESLRGATTTEFWKSVSVCVCVWWCGRGGNMAKAWKTCNAVRLFVMCSRALQQRWGFGKPSPHRQADRSRGIPDIFWLFVFHQEASRCSRLLLQSAACLFELHITPEHAPTMSEPTKNPPQKVH